VSEVFVPIEGYSGYFIGSRGTVWSQGYGPLKPRIHNGYEAVQLGRGNKEYVHRLVAKHFLSDRDEEVNHKNFDRTDNRVQNLEWTSKIENMRHAGQAKLSERERKNVKKMYLETEKTQAEVGKHFGIHKSMVSRIINQ
jgi:DNA-directed RNA polymerase specialized sigma subunit